MILNSMDGAYYLVTQGPDTDGPTIPRGTVGVSVNAVPDFVLITTIGSWEDVHVHVTVLPMPFRQSGPSGGWDSQVDAEIEVSGSLWLTDMEHDPVGPEISLHSGRHLVQVRARSIDTVRRSPFLQIDGRPTEQHLVYLSPVK